MDVLSSYFSPTRQGRPAQLRGKAAAIQRRTFEQHGTTRLLKVFVCFKALLLAVAILSTGPGYDTSTQILLQNHAKEGLWPRRALEHLALRLTRWDGLYFTSASLHGKAYEQEWAFSWALSNLSSLVARVSLAPLSMESALKHALAGILLSHLSHLGAVFTLYHLTYELTPAKDDRKRAIAFTASALHVLSPAGLFLSAPYGESTFALLNFAGMLAYTVGTKAYASHAIQQQRTAGSWMVYAGLSYGAAAMIRSNGLLSGTPFAWDAIETLLPIGRFLKQRDSSRHWKFVTTVVAGICVALCFALPQVVAYVEYCTDGNTRPWCRDVPPSIYTWVQSRYWGVGFLKYWTLNNLPLFALAVPMLATVLRTAWLALLQPAKLSRLATSGAASKDGDISDERQTFERLLRRLAVPQLVLTVLAATSFHVQIINRISSGYAVWYIVLALAIHAEPTERAQALGAWASDGAMRWIVRAMVMYAIVQGGLYACFLPPA